jgi:hypothetical protein
MSSSSIPKPAPFLESLEIGKVDSTRFDKEGLGEFVRTVESTLADTIAAKPEDSTVRDILTKEFPSDDEWEALKSRGCVRLTFDEVRDRMIGKTKTAETDEEADDLQFHDSPSKKRSATSDANSIDDDVSPSDPKRPKLNPLHFNVLPGQGDDETYRSRLPSTENDSQAIPCDVPLWTPQTRPKPTTGNVLVSFITQSTSSYYALPLRQYLLPANLVTDHHWEVLTAVDQFYFCPYSRLEEDFHVDDQKRIRSAFRPKKGTTIVSIEDFLVKEFGEYVLPVHAVARLENVTALIQTGVITE